MLANIALLICTSFVFWLLRLDHKQAPKVSPALWIPTIWMLVNMSKPLGAWFASYGGKSVEEGSPLDQILLSALLCIGLVILVRRRFSWSTAFRNNTWLLLLLGYMLASVTWSDIPFISFKRWIREFIAVVMFFVIATESEPRQACQSIIRRIIYVLIPFSYILINYYGEYGREYNPWEGYVMWIGAATQKNALCMICLIAIFYLVWSFIRRRQGEDIPAWKYQTHFEVVILILSLWIMGGPNHNLSYSVTANVSLILGLSMLIGFNWFRKRRTNVNLKLLPLIIALIIIYGTTTPFIGKLTIGEGVSSTFGRDSSLTGRDEIWGELIPKAMKRPILGYGCGGFWTSESIEQARIASAHNGYLETILNLGFVGHIIFSLFLLSCCWKAQREITEDFDWGICLACFILMTVVHNMAESSCASFTGKIIGIVIILTVSSIKVPHTNLCMEVGMGKSPMQ